MSDFDVIAVFDWKTGGQVRAAGCLRRDVDDAAQLQLRRDGRSDVRDSAQKYGCRKQAFNKTRHDNQVATGVQMLRREQMRAFLRSSDTCNSA